MRTANYEFALHVLWSRKQVSLAVLEEEMLYWWVNNIICSVLSRISFSVSGFKRACDYLKRSRKYVHLSRWRFSMRNFYTDILGSTIEKSGQIPCMFSFYFWKINDKKNIYFGSTSQMWKTHIELYWFRCYNEMNTLLQTSFNYIFEIIVCFHLWFELECLNLVGCC